MKKLFAIAVFLSFIAPAAAQEFWLRPVAKPDQTGVLPQLAAWLQMRGPFTARATQ